LTGYSRNAGDRVTPNSNTNRDGTLAEMVDAALPQPGKRPTKNGRRPNKMERA